MNSRVSLPLARMHDRECQILLHALCVYIYVNYTRAQSKWYETFCCSFAVEGVWQYTHLIEICHLFNYLIPT